MKFNKKMKKPTEEEIKKKEENYQEIKKKWNRKTIENLEEAIKTYPSKHLVGNKEEWEKTTDKQTDYSNKKNKLYAEQLQKEYNFTKAEWEELESQFFVEEIEESKKLKN